MDGLLGVAGMIITSDEMDHSREFPAFSTSKSIPNSANWLLVQCAHLEK